MADPTIQDVTYEDFNPDCTEDVEELLAWHTVFETLDNYVTLRAAAIEHRRKGDIRDALRAEARMEALYKHIPQGMRW